MNIAIVGNDAAFNEAKEKLGIEHHYYHTHAVNSDLSHHSIELFFDFSPEWSAETVVRYQSIKTPVFINSIYTTLAAVREKIKTQGLIFGFCGLPTFFNRALLEVTISQQSDQEQLGRIMEELKINYAVVKDQVGMVTPRVIGMIINEAYDALKHGVASREDIDLSMKLGTNYPYGPFEWSEKIGNDRVKNLLNALLLETGDGRYRPTF